MNDKHLPDASAENPWLPLRQLTPARIALGRTGTSLPTRPQLDFQYAHAQARDAVHLPFDHAAISDGLRQRGRDSLLLHSAAADRHVYLQRPDLGRRLDEASVQRLREHAAGYDGQIDLAIVVADGLSALAVQRHTLLLPRTPGGTGAGRRLVAVAGGPGGTGTGGGGRRDR